MKYCILMLIGCLSLSSLAQTRILLDGHFDDWGEVPLAFADATGDAGQSGIDLGDLHVYQDAQYLFFRLSTGTLVNLQSNNELTLYLDTDNQSSSGLSVQGIGAELVYTLGARQGTAFLNGNSHPVFHSDIGLVSAPTVSATEFEFALRRDAVIQGTPLFPGPNIRILIRDQGPNGDALPDQNGGVAYEITTDSLSALPSYTLVRPAEADFRVLSYNVLTNGPFDPSRAGAFGRVMQAIQPDIIGFQEIYNHSSAQVANWVESVLPSGPGEQWYHAQSGPDIHAISRYPILQSAPTTNNGAFLIDWPGDPDLFMVVAHPPCCANDAGRQFEIDAMMGFVRVAKAGNGPIPLQANTPILILGDMNLVGDPQQLQTLLTGNIVDEATHGPDFAPDWDGSSLLDAQPYNTNLPMSFTWYNESSSFSPGRLDFVFYSGSQLVLKNAYSLFTPALPGDSLTTFGLFAQDVPTASDHLPVVADFELSSATGLVEFEKEAGVVPMAIYPNPARKQVTIQLQLPEVGNIKLQLYDVNGKQLGTLWEGKLSVGVHRIQADLGQFSSGRYWVSLKTAKEQVGGSLMIMR